MAALQSPPADWSRSMAVSHAASSDPLTLVPGTLTFDSYYTVVLLLVLACVSALSSLPKPHRSRLVHFAKLVAMTVVDAVSAVVWRVNPLRRYRPVYMMDLVTFAPPVDWQITHEHYATIAGRYFQLPKDTVDFCMKVLSKSGLGERTAFPPGINSDPPDIGMAMSRYEVSIVLFTIIDQLFADNPALRPADIDILIVNCSLFNPTPSMTSMIVNHYKMKSSIQSYQLGGQGCSAGLLSLHLAKDLLTVHANSTAMIVSLECITPSIYLGTEQSMLVSNSIFRCGGSVCLLSNRFTDYLGINIASKRAVFELQITARTHCGANDEAFHCVWQCEDSKGYRGVALSKSLMAVAAKSIERHLTPLAHRLLPAREIVKYLVYTYLLKVKYSPSFSGAVLPCIHAGGKGVLDGVQQALKLSDRDMLVSRLVLHERGNVSSSSVFYELQAYQQGRGPRPLVKGDRVWQLAFGSGFKVNSAVWKAL